MRVSAEAKAKKREYDQEYQQRTEVQARRREYQREYYREYYQRPKPKAKKREYQQRTEVQARRRPSGSLPRVLPAPKAQGEDGSTSWSTTGVKEEAGVPTAHRGPGQASGVPEYYHARTAKAAREYYQRRKREGETP